MSRISTIDGMRGYFLVFMLINHLTFTGGYYLVYFNHAKLGFVEDAQGFVFLSGLLAGMVYTRRMMRGGFAEGARRLWSRSAELYAYTMACILTVLLLRMILPDAPEIWNNWLGGLGSGKPAFYAGAATLTYQATFLDILPQYIVYMVVAPPLIWLVINGRWLTVVAGSLFLWLCVQLGLHLPAVAGINALLAELDPGLHLRVPFNVLAWQVLFIVAMVIGVLMARGKFETRRFFDPADTRWVKACALSVLLFVGFRLGFTFDLVPASVTERFRDFENRSEFSLVFMVNFVLLGYVFAWLLIAGAEAADSRVRRIAGFLTFVFNLSFLRLLGRHSLQIYAWHVVLVYMVLWVDKSAGPFNEFTKTAIAVAGILLLSLPAVWRERRTLLAVEQRSTP